MVASLRVASAIAGLVLCACATARPAESARAAQVQPAEHSIDHCLLTLGFADISGESPYPQLIRDDPQLVAVWAPAVGSDAPDAPYSVASVRRGATEWTVDFVHGNGRGPDASYFSIALSNCLAVHSHGVDVDLEAKRFLDRR